MNAYLDGYRRAFDFKGRSTRPEFWLFMLFATLAVIVASLIDTLVFRETGTTWLASLVSLAQIVPSLSVGVRRLHDTGRSGWWYLIGLIPLIGWIVLLVFLCGRTRPTPSLTQRARPRHAGRRSGNDDGPDTMSSGAAFGLGVILSEGAHTAGAAIASSGDADDDGGGDADNDADADVDADVDADMDFDMD